MQWTIEEPGHGTDRYMIHLPKSGRGVTALRTALMGLDRARETKDGRISVRPDTLADAQAILAGELGQAVARPIAAAAAKREQAAADRSKAERDAARARREAEADERRAVAAEGAAQWRADELRRLAALPYRPTDDDEEEDAAITMNRPADQRERGLVDWMQRGVKRS